MSCTRARRMPSWSGHGAVLSAVAKRGRLARNAQYALNANGWPRHPCCHHGTSTCDVDARDGGTEIPRHGSASVHSGDDEVCTRSRSSNFRASAEEKEGALAEVCRMRISNKWMARGLIVSINHICLLCLSTTFGYLSHWGPVCGRLWNTGSPLGPWPLGNKRHRHRSTNVYRCAGRGIQHKKRGEGKG